MKSCIICWIELKTGIAECGVKKMSYDVAWEILGSLENIAPGIHYFMQCTGTAVNMSCTIGG